MTNVHVQLQVNHIQQNIILVYQLALPQIHIGTAHLAQLVQQQMLIHHIGTAHLAYHVHQLTAQPHIGTAQLAYPVHQ